MRVIVDTNVPVVANNRGSHAPLACVLECVNRIRRIQSGQTLVLDDKWLIVREYMQQLRSEGQPGVGDGFLRWVLTNQKNPRHCETVAITLLDFENGFEEFPRIPELADFDPSDRKFVAVAIAHPEHPPILNAVDTDWQIFREVLARQGVTVESLCGELTPKQRETQSF